MYGRLIKSLDRAADASATVGMALAILALLATSVLMIVEIGFRWFLQSSTHLMEVVVGYGMAIMTFGPLAYALRHGDLIRVALLADRLKPNARWLLEIGVNAVGALIVAFFCYHFWIDLSRNIARGTSTGGFIAVPLWVPSIIIFSSLVILLITLVANTLALLGDPSRVPPKGQAE